MKKKFAAILCTFVLLLACLCLPAFAAGKPSIEIMYMVGISGVDTPIRGASPTIYYRNNTNKPMKYVEWYVTSYNRVGDATPDIRSGITTKRLTTIGPILPFQLVRESSAPITTKWLVSENSPFKSYKTTRYWIAVGDNFRTVYQDEYNNFFVPINEYDWESCIYLTEDEIENALFAEWCNFGDIDWYSNVITRIRVDNVKITYMDESTEILEDIGSKYRGMSLQNPPFVQQLAQYQAVYNYQDYLNCNPDLAAQFGANQKALFEHFVTQGMKEGRQGSAEFNLNAYKANNPDLVAMFGDDNVKYYEHFISSGRAEGRVAV